MSGSWACLAWGLYKHCSAVKLLGGWANRNCGVKVGLHWDWGPCLVVGAQGKTLEAWVVKLLGGLSASARAQRTLDSLSLWRVYTLQRGSRFVGDGMFFCGDRQAAWRPGALKSWVGIL